MEVQDSIPRNKPWNGFVPIGKVWRNSETSLAADAHAFDAILEAGDYSSLSDVE
jgi:hypothetical protein